MGAQPKGAPDVPNYNAICLGQHDALLAGSKLIEFTADKATEILKPECANFVTGSVLPEKHIEAIVGLIGSSQERQCNKGDTALSPLSAKAPVRAIRRRFTHSKEAAPCPYSGIS
jgi:hypothetical protein